MACKILWSAKGSLLRKGITINPRFNMRVREARFVHKISQYNITRSVKE